MFAENLDFIVYIGTIIILLSHNRFQNVKTRQMPTTQIETEDVKQ